MPLVELNAFRCPVEGAQPRARDGGTRRAPSAYGPGRGLRKSKKARMLPLPCRRRSGSNRCSHGSSNASVNGNSKRYDGRTRSSSPHPMTTRPDNDPPGRRGQPFIPRCEVFGPYRIPFGRAIYISSICHQATLLSRVAGRRGHGNTNAWDAITPSGSTAARSGTVRPHGESLAKEVIAAPGAALPWRNRTDAPASKPVRRW